MEKSLHSKGYRIFLRHLKAVREQAGVTQISLARRIGETQSFVSKCERGERRIDVVELKLFCKAIGVSFTEFAKLLEREIR
jgi:transcriptional regulator with XRE-family HTH domain